MNEVKKEMNQIKNKNKNKIKTQQKENVIYPGVDTV